MKKYRVQIDCDDSFDEEIEANSEEEAEDIGMSKFESQRGYPQITIDFIEDIDDDYSTVLDEYENGEPNGEPLENQLSVWNIRID